MRAGSSFTLHGNTFTAALAVYKSAEPNPMQREASRIGTNPNSAFSSIQRVRLSFEGEGALKNTGFARNYVLKRRMYCSSGAKWAANTGDDALNKVIQDYIKREWETAGVNCSLMDAFGRVGDCWLPERGDAALRIFRTRQGKMKVEEISADRIGELFYFQDGFQSVREITLSDGKTVLTPREGDAFMYFGGLYFDGPEVVAYKIYKRTGDTLYTDPKNYLANEIIFFKDDIMGGVRGVTIFATALLIINGKNQILTATIQTMQQQSKIAAIASNNSGGPSEYTYETRVGQDGTVEYTENYADGAIVKYQYNGDSYQVLKAEHPTEAFIGGMKYLDWEAAGTVGMTGEFLYTPADSGGAPSRFSFSIASREIERIRQDIHLPKLRKLAELTIAQGIREKKIPSNNPRVFEGTMNFGVLPTADAFRDTQSAIKEDRAGLTTKSAITTTYLGRDYVDILNERGTEVIARKKQVALVNAELKKLGLPEDCTDDDLSMLGDQPKQDAQAQEIEQEDGAIPPKKKSPSKKTAAMSAFHGWVKPEDLPEETRLTVEKMVPGARIRRFGMTAAELISKADPLNLDAARKRIRYQSCESCGEEVHANEEKHLLMVNDRLIDGHHFLAKAEKGKVTKSLPVLDLIPPITKASFSFNEADHPRVPAGMDTGGEFTADGTNGGEVSPEAQKRVDDAILDIKDGSGELELYHGTRNKNPSIHQGQTFADNQDTADRYASKKTFSGKFDTKGLKIAKVKAFDRDDINYGAIGDSDDDIKALGNRGIDLIIFDDEDPHQRQHTAYRLISPKAVKRAKESMELIEN